MEVEGAGTWFRQGDQITQPNSNVNNVQVYIWKSSQHPPHLLHSRRHETNELLPHVKFHLHGFLPTHNTKRRPPSCAWNHATCISSQSNKQAGDKPMYRGNQYCAQGPIDNNCLKRGPRLYFSSTLPLTNMRQSLSFVLSDALIPSLLFAICKPVAMSVPDYSSKCCEHTSNPIAFFCPIDNPAASYLHLLPFWSSLLLCPPWAHCIVWKRDWKEGRKEGRRSRVIKVKCEHIEHENIQHQTRGTMSMKWCHKADNTNP